MCKQHGNGGCFHPWDGTLRHLGARPRSVLCGGSLPAQILPANEANPEGYWEPAEAVRIDDAFLFANGSTWFDPSFQLQGEVNISPPEREAFIHRVSQLLMTWPRGNFLVVKERGSLRLPIYGSRLLSAKSSLSR